MTNFRCRFRVAGLLRLACSTACFKLLIFLPRAASIGAHSGWHRPCVIKAFRSIHVSRMVKTFRTSESRALSSAVSMASATLHPDEISSPATFITSGPHECLAAKSNKDLTARASSSGKKLWSRDTVVSGLMDFSRFRPTVLLRLGVGDALVESSATDQPACSLSGSVVCFASDTRPSDSAASPGVSPVLTTR